MTNRLLSRDQTARYLRSYGLRTTPASLATMANRGGGPRFLRIGRYCFYQITDLEDWLSHRCSGLLDSTSTRHGQAVQGLFNEIGEFDEYPIYTGQAQFDYITSLLNEEEDIGNSMDSIGAIYDQQFA